MLQGYVLPQKIDKNTDGDVKIFFRARNVFKNCAVKVECDGKTIVYKKKRIVLPGEMETVSLPSDSVKALSGKVTVSLEV